MYDGGHTAFRNAAYLAGSKPPQVSHFIGASVPDKAASPGGAHRRQPAHPYMVNQAMNPEWYKVCSPTHKEVEGPADGVAMIQRSAAASAMESPANRYHAEHLSFGIPGEASSHADPSYNSRYNIAFPKQQHAQAVSFHDHLSGNELRTAAAANSTRDAMRLAEMRQPMHNMEPENSMAYLAGSSSMIGQVVPVGSPPLDDSTQRALQDLAVENVHLKQRLQQAYQDILHLQGCLRQVQSEGQKQKYVRGQSRYWSNEEHQRFIDAIEQYGPRDVKLIAQCVGTRSPTQVRTHAQKYFIKLARQQKGGANCPTDEYNSGSEGDREGQGNYSEAGSGSDACKDNSSLSAAETVESGGSRGSERSVRSNMYGNCGENSQSSASPEATSESCSSPAEAAAIK